jgi:hypothetical protein
MRFTLVGEARVDGTRRRGRFRAPSARSASVAALAVLVALLWLSTNPLGARAAASCTGPSATVTYSGSYKDVLQNPTDAGYSDNTASRTIVLSWSDKVTGPVFGQSIQSCFPTPDHVTYAASGSYSYTPTAVGISIGAQPCSASISVAPGLQDFLYVRASVHAVGAGAGSISSASASGFAPPQDLTGLQSSDPKCFDPTYGPFPGPPAANRDPNYNAFSSVGITNRVGSDGQPIGPTSKTWKFSDSGSDGQGGTDSVSGTETVSYSIGCGTATSAVLASAGPSCSACPNPADKALLEAVQDKASPPEISSIKAASHKFQLLVKSIRATGGGEQQQVDEVASKGPAYESGLRRAYDEDLKRLAKLEQGWLARAKCRATRDKIKMLVEAGDDYIEVKYVARKDDVDNAQLAIRDGCTCGGF